MGGSGRVGGWAFGNIEGDAMGNEMVVSRGIVASALRGAARMLAKAYCDAAPVGD